LSDEEIFKQFPQCTPTNDAKRDLNIRNMFKSIGAKWAREYLKDRPAPEKVSNEYELLRLKSEIMEVFKIHNFDIHIGDEMLKDVATRIVKLDKWLKIITETRSKVNSNPL
jgi:hypothetical protein